LPSKPHLICCGILKKEVEKLIQQGQLDVEPYFLDAGLHAVYADLEKELTDSLDKAQQEAENGIVVVYGDMCHPRIKKITKQYSAIKVDALNCIDCLLGGHKNLLKIDPKCSHFYLSPGWMPSNLKKNKYFKKIFNWNMEDIKDQFKHLNGLIILDSLDNLEELESDIEEFSFYSGLKVKSTKHAELNGLKAVIEEAIQKTIEDSA
jgi:hypothetical protein